MAEPAIRVETREELIYLLAEAAAIEHNIMCCYLYAAWSLKRTEADGLTEKQVAAVKEWRAAIMSVAVEEMTHLALVCNLTSSIGGSPHLSRPDFPIPPGHHPSGVILDLTRFSPGLLDHFIFLERPEGVELRDATGFEHPLNYHRTARKGTLMPSAQDYKTVGHLYRGIMHGFEVLTHLHGEANLFCGDVGAQVGQGEASLPGLMTVSDLKSAEAAIETIIEQGEGAPSHSEDSHYSRFLRLRDQLNGFLAADPGFDPAFPVAHNPIARHLPTAAHCIYINAPESRQVLDLANSVYAHMVRCLVQAFGRGPAHRDDKMGLVTLAIDLMFVLDKIAPHLASLPANHAHPGVNAGITFTLPLDVQRLPEGRGEMLVLHERVKELAVHAATLFPAPHPLDLVAARLEQIAGTIKVPGATTAAPARPAAPPMVDVPHRGSSHNSVEGEELTVSFNGKRCIHARFCVLGAPSAFRANTPGQWLHPESVPAEDIVRIAYNCPSGAITYTPKGALRPEAPPAVNTINVRENGPYAFRGDLKLNGESIGYRATLCRCGASNNKPFCDCAHNTIGFVSTGEPASRTSEPLPGRNGPVEIAPERDGPLVVTGNIEICAGTGHTIDRVTRARLCRCGASHTKPFCDMTHKKIGFHAE